MPEAAVATLHYSIVPPGDVARTPEDAALLDLLRLLRDKGYQFVTPTPATHARVVARPDRRLARSLIDVLGWSRPYLRGTLGRDVEVLLRRAGVLLDDGAAPRSRVRVSSLHGDLFLHSAFPTDAPDAVFFGPDSYRFADLIRAELTDRPPRADARIVDIGTGSGVGAIVAARACPGARLQMTDVNPAALRLARVNAAAADVAAEAFESATLEPIRGEIDVVTANPPFIIDAQSRLYRDGGGMHGGQVSLDMARMGLDRLAPGGRLILYTGSAIVDGDDGLRRALVRETYSRGFELRYWELDPDIFGEELETDAYRDVDRIALVAAIITRPG
jgi:methylase of polypeptide subunit release factors